MMDPAAILGKSCSRENARARKNTQDEKEEEFLDAKKTLIKLFPRRPLPFLLPEGTRRRTRRTRRMRPRGRRRKGNAKNALVEEEKEEEEDIFFRRIRRFWSDGLQTR